MTYPTPVVPKHTFGGLAGSLRCYDLAVGTLAVNERFAALPRGRTSLPEDVARAAQRARLLRAIISTTAEQGFPAVTIADVVERARVSREAFYHHFDDKEACFVAACDEGAEVMFARIRGAVASLDGEDVAGARLRAGLRAYLDFVAAEPEFARCFTIDCFAAGPNALAMRAAAHERFASMHRAWHRRLRKRKPELPRASNAVYPAMVGATYELVLALVREGRTADAPRLERTLAPLLLSMLGIN